MKEEKHWNKNEKTYTKRTTRKKSYERIRSTEKNNTKKQQQQKQNQKQREPLEKKSQ